MPKVGLRFRRGDARILENLARRAQSMELRGGADIFAKAAKAARIGEPLVVICDTPEEAKQMAEGYSLYGMKAPVIEQLHQ